MSSFTVHLDIFQAVVEHCDLPSLHRLCFTNHAVGRLATHVLYRRVNLRETAITDKPLLFFLTTLFNSRLASMVRSVAYEKIWGYGYIVPEEWWECLEGILPALDRVQRLEPRLSSLRDGVLRDALTTSSLVPYALSRMSNLRHISIGSKFHHDWIKLVSDGHVQMECRLQSLYIQEESLESLLGFFARQTSLRDVRTGTYAYSSARVISGPFPNSKDATRHKTTAEDLDNASKLLPELHVFGWSSDHDMRLVRAITKDKIIDTIFVDFVGWFPTRPERHIEPFMDVHPTSRPHVQTATFWFTIYLNPKLIGEIFSTFKSLKTIRLCFHCGSLGALFKALEASVEMGCSLKHLHLVVDIDPGFPVDSPSIGVALERGRRRGKLHGIHLDLCIYRESSSWVIRSLETQAGCPTCFDYFDQPWSPSAKPTTRGIEAWRQLNEWIY